jgi:hypothetical protein
MYEAPTPCNDPFLAQAMPTCKVQSLLIYMELLGEIRRHDGTLKTRHAVGVSKRVSVGL